MRDKQENNSDAVVKAQASNDALQGLIAFAKPITIAGVNYTHFGFREATVDDMFESEDELAQTGRGTQTPLQFNAQMMIRQITKVVNDKGEMFEGPFTLNMLKAWGTKNYSIIRAKQIEMDVLGEAESSDSASP